MQEQESDVVGYHRPRRPNAETIAYLKSLPFDVGVARAEIQAFVEQQQQQQQQQLGSFPSKFRKNAKKDDDDDDDSQERSGVVFPQNLAAALSALEEIQHEIASLAGDEEAAVIVEIMAHITAPYSDWAARTLLLGVTGYAVHLATHRYGSHVLQTLLQVCTTQAPILSMTNSAVLDWARHPDAPPIATLAVANHRDNNNSSITVDDPPSIGSLIVALQQELVPHATALALHVCGSHVLRTLICCLGGVQMICGSSSSSSSSSSAISSHMNEVAVPLPIVVRRGKWKDDKKKKKKKHHTSAALAVDDLENGRKQVAAGGRLQYVAHSRLRDDDDGDSELRQQALEELAEALTGTDVDSESGELQQWLCHASAGPLLTLLLQVLTYRDAAAEWKNRVISLTSADTPVTTFADHHLGRIPPEPLFALNSSAHALVQRLLCWQPSIIDANKQSSARDILYTLAADPRGSHTVEMILKLSPDIFYDDILQAGQWLTKEILQEYAHHSVSNFVVQALLTTARTKSQADQLRQGLLPLLESGYIMDLTKRRRGILWRLVEMSVKYQTGQAQILQAILVGFRQMTNSENEKTKQNMSTASFSKCIPALLALRPPSRPGDRLLLDVAGTRTVYNLLQFQPASLCKETVQGIVQELSVEDLEWLAKDGLGSRCIWDGLLDRAAQSHQPTCPIFTSAIKKLVNKMAGHWANLASDRVAHHVVQHVFRSAGDNMSSRMALVKELSESKHRLQGNHMGRTVLETCMVREWDASARPDDWCLAIKQALSRRILVDDIVMACSGDDARRKRKVREPVATTSEDIKGGEGPSEGKGLTLDAIMDAITVPNQAKKDMSNSQPKSEQRKSKKLKKSKTK